MGQLQRAVAFCCSGELWFILRRRHRSLCACALAKRYLSLPSPQVCEVTPVSGRSASPDDMLVVRWRAPAPQGTARLSFAESIAAR